MKEIFQIYEVTGKRRTTQKLVNESFYPDYLSWMILKQAISIDETKFNGELFCMAQFITKQ